MVLLPAGLVFGKAIMDSLSARGAAHVARTSAVTAGVVSHARKRTTKKPHTNPFTHDEVRNRLGGTSIRYSSSQAKREAQELKEAFENEDWVPVYRYRGIHLARLMTRGKLVTTVLSMLYLPYSSFLLLTGSNDLYNFSLTTAVALASPLLLFAFSRYYNRLIGVIAMNHSNDFVRVGYLSFWGSRKDKYYELKDVMPLSDSGGGNGVYVFRSYSHQNYLFLSSKHAEIVDEDRAELLFGSLSPFNTEKKM